LPAVETPQSASPEPSEPPAKPSRSPSDKLRSAQEYANKVKGRVESSRPRHRSVDLAYSFTEHDRDVGGGLLAAALAFRLFLWFLPAALVLVGGLGFAPQKSSLSTARQAHLGNFAAEVIEKAHEDSNRSRWVLLLLGLFFLYFASVKLAKTVVAATAFAWRIPLPNIRNKARAGACTTGFLVLALFLSFYSTWLRQRSTGIGVTVTAFLVVVWGVLWWVAAAKLPKAEGVSWLRLWPGALLVGVGMQVMNLVSVFYLQRKITSSSGLYGGLGAAAVIILYAYLLARLIIGSCALNAILASRRQS
jgi:uncharacterized BrkB/YihY/UPF0761 family membrane protein